MSGWTMAGGVCGECGTRQRRPGACARCGGLTGIAREFRHEEDAAAARVFTYGTLRPSLGCSLAEGVLGRGRARAAGAPGRGRASERALLPGRMWALVFPVVKLDEAGAGRVVGELVRATAEELRRMDAVELGAGYRRELRAAWLESGLTEAVWVYVFEGDTARWCPVPSGDFGEVLAARRAAEMAETEEEESNA